MRHCVKVKSATGTELRNWDRKKGAEAKQGVDNQQLGSKAKAGLK